MCVEQVHTVFNRQSDKPRGYAFIEFDHERDMHGTLISLVSLDQRTVHVSFMVKLNECIATRLVRLSVEHCVNLFHTHTATQSVLALEQYLQKPFHSSSNHCPVIHFI